MVKAEPERKSDITGVMTCEGVMIPTKIKRMSMTAIARPICKALFITIPTKNPSTRGMMRAKMNVRDRSGGRMKAISK